MCARRPYHLCRIRAAQAASHGWRTCVHMYARRAAALAPTSYGELLRARAIAMRHCVCMRTLSLLAGPLPSPRRAFLSVSMSRRWRYVVLHASTAGLGGCRCACARVGPISHVDYVPMSPPAPASDPNPNTVTSWAERLASACGFSPGSFFGNLV